MSSGRSAVLARLFGDRRARVASVVVVLYVLVALAAALDLFALDPDARVGEKLLGPGAGHWLGTDRQGRDVFVRTVFAARPAVLVGLVSAIAATIFGAVLGAAAAWWRGAVDAFVVWLYSTLQSIPSILLLVALAYVAGKGLGGVYAALLATAWIGPCRLVRAEVSKLRELGFVEAARALGYGGPRIVVRHLLPNTLPVVVPTAIGVFIDAVKSEVILSYLGLGVIGAPSWGTMIHQASTSFAAGHWAELAAPTVAMAVLVLALTTLAGALHDALDPTSTSRAPRA